ncbi:MAG TPA: MBL fold metallo-hydrolase [Usitatibacter sp.]|nr:MBL fold metallo-hydrolase [Usitatibacter sp.]
MIRTVSRHAIGIAISLAVVSFPACAEDAEALLKRVAASMGVSEVKTLRYATEGTGYTFGQAYVPTAAWPKITVHSQVRTINYETGSMREQFTLSRAEPKGGGGYPLSGQQSNDWYVSGAHAWNVAGGNPQPGERFVRDRTHQLWITPAGVVMAGLRNKAQATFDNAGGGLAVVTFTEPGRFAARVFVNRDYLIDRVESRAPDSVLGEVSFVTTYSDYQDFNGVKFPSRIRQTQAGHPVLDVTVKEVARDVPADITAPEAVKAADRVTSEQVADGVWFIAGATHNSVVIEMDDHIVLVESPLGDFRAVPVMEQAKKLVPNKPLRYVINSHNHFDHSGGLRAAAAEGAIIVTHAGNKPYFEKAFATHSKIAPDRLTASKRKAQFVEVDDNMLMTDGKRTLSIMRVKESAHNDTFLMVYLPKERLLIEADAYTPLPPNAAPPATANAYHLNLIENMKRMNLKVDRILPLHGRVVPVNELYTTAKMTPG